MLTLGLKYFGIPQKIYAGNSLALENNILYKQKDGASLQTVFRIIPASPSELGQNEPQIHGLAALGQTQPFSRLAFEFSHLVKCRGTVVSASWHYLRMSHIR